MTIFRWWSTALAVVAIGAFAGGCRKEAPAPSAPSSAPASAHPTSGEAKYEGTHDTTDCNVTAGWAWNRGNPDEHVTVEVYDGEAKVTAVEANLMRPDLPKAGIGDGKHGFNVPMPGLKDGKPHTVTVRVNGQPLSKSPKQVTCPAA